MSATTTLALKDVYHIKYNPISNPIILRGPLQEHFLLHTSSYRLFITARQFLKLIQLRYEVLYGHNSILLQFLNVVCHGKGDP